MHHPRFASLFLLIIITSGNAAAQAWNDDIDFTIRSTRTLDSDGADTGLNAYELIREFGGPNPIESPDLYSLNHPEVEHIYEDFDEEVGNHFVFTSHRDIDRDRNRYQTTDRQRNEIKTYASSEDAVKGYEKETMVFSWKFKIDDGMEVSKRFSHFFQLKAVGGNDSQPIVTISGAEHSGRDTIEVRHSSDESGSYLDHYPLDNITGEWLEVYTRANFAEEGNLRLIVKRLSDDEVILDVDESHLDMWRGTEPEHFVRPKWGIYRSLADAENLRAEEEIVRFANFEVLKLEPTP